MNAESGSDQLKISLDWRKMCKTVIIPEVKTSNTVSHEKTVIRKCFIFNKQLPFTFTELPESETVCALYFEVCFAYYVVHFTA